MMLSNGSRIESFTIRIFKGNVLKSKGVVFLMVIGVFPRAEQEEKANHNEVRKGMQKVRG